MQENYRNICRIARRAAGLTQERFAEALDVSVESIRLYETERGMPSDDVVTRMIEISGLPVLGYWHLLNKSRIAADILPKLDEVPLPQAVIQLICRMREFAARHSADTLMSIAEDGVIDDEERPQFDAIVGELSAIVKAAMQLRYATGGAEHDI